MRYVMESMYHLRRVNFQTFIAHKEQQKNGAGGAGGNAAAAGGTATTASAAVADKFAINDRLTPSTDPVVQARSTLILLDRTTKIGRNPDAVDVVLHSTIHSNMISRFHAEITGELDGNGNSPKHYVYFIDDKSLNGTYINDTRVNGKVTLKEGDLIKFGHVNGAAIKPGDYAPQQVSESEFVFRFERATRGQHYFGYTDKGTRVHSQQEKKRAYMQINSDRITPIDVFGSSLANNNAMQNRQVSFNGQQPTPHVAQQTNLVALFQPLQQNSNISAAYQQHQHNSDPHTTISSTSVSGSTSVVPRTSVSNPPATQNNQPMAAASAQIAHPQPLPPSSANLSSQFAAANLTAEEFNAHLRQLMASDSFAQQWNAANLLKFSGLQQQNTLASYGSAAAAAAALLNNTAAASYATLWPNLAQQCRIALQPNQAALAAASSYVNAAANSFQPQLRMPAGFSQLYQPLQQPSASGINSVGSLSGNNIVQAALLQPSSVLTNATISTTSTPTNSSIFLFNGNNGHSNTIHRGTPTIVGCSDAGLNFANAVSSVLPGGSCSLFSQIPVSSSAYSSCTSTAANSIRASAACERVSAVESPLTSLSNVASALSRNQNIGPSLETVQSTNVSSSFSSIDDLRHSNDGGSAFVSNGSSQKHSTVACSSSGVSAPLVQRIPIASALAAAVVQNQAAGSNINVRISPQLLLNSTRQNSTEMNSLPTTSTTAGPPISSTISVVSGTPVQQNLPAYHRVAENQRHSSSMSSSGIGSSCSSTQSALLHSPIDKLDHLEFSSKYSNTPTLHHQSSVALSSLAAVMFNNARPTDFTSTALISPPLKQQGLVSNAPKERKKYQRKPKVSTDSTISNTEIVVVDPISLPKPSPITSPSLVNGNFERLKIITSTSSCDANDVTLPPFAHTPDAASSEFENPLLAKLIECDLQSTSPAKPHQESLDPILVVNVESNDVVSKASPSKIASPQLKSLPLPKSPPLPPQTPSPRAELREERDRSESHNGTSKLSDREDNFDKLDETRKARKMSLQRHQRKSNEVSRLLNDLTAGNCSWQYQAERKQKLLAKAAARGISQSKVIGKQGPLRLVERKMLEIQRRKSHKMMRQISDESSGTESGNENNAATKPKQFPLDDKNLLLSSSSSSSTGSGSGSDDSNSDSESPSAAKSRRSTSLASNKSLKSLPFKSPTEKPKLNGHGPIGVSSTFNSVKSRTEKLQKRCSKDKLILHQQDTTKPTTNGNLVENDQQASNSLARIERRGRPRKRLPTPTSNSSSSESDTEKAESASKDIPSNPAAKRERKRPGRKPKKTKLLSGSDDDSDHKQIVIDDWAYHDPERDTCAHSKCQRPQHSSLNWVQCDLCDRWYHALCVLGSNSELDDEFEFNCGCTADKQQIKAVSPDWSVLANKKKAKMES